MAQKHLRELLSEDQEPFLLSSYIADRKSQLTSPAKARKLMKPAPKSPPIFAGSFCKSVCLFSVLPDSPDYRKSPLFEFAAAAASPRKSPNRIFLHVPAKTAALLLEAAVRIQQKGASPVKPKPAKKGLFGSILRRLTQRNREAPTREIESARRRSFGASRGTSANAQLKTAAEKSASPGRCRGHSRRSSGLWSESNGERSLDLETSTSTSGSDSVELVPEEEEVYAAFDEGFCASPFKFVLRRSPSSSGDRTPDFASPAASPAASPTRHGKEETDCRDVESSKKLIAEEEEEEKEQCSPVSVLDPPFEDGHDQEEEEEDGFDYECSFANVQRAKQILLEKLRRFEKLAGLDPVELEKRMLEQDEDEDDDGYIIRVEEDEDGEEPELLDDELGADQLVMEVLRSKFDSAKKVPSDLKRLVSDLVAEEWGRLNELGLTLTRRVCDRLDSWKRVDLSTIDMMVEEDFRRELHGWSWKHDQDQVEEVASGIELAVLGLLVGELLEDLH